MSKFVIIRLSQGIIVLLGVSVFSFLLVHLSGDPVSGLVQPDWTPEQVEDLRVRLGFDRPLWVQYFDFLQRAVRGDFGNSFRQHLPVFQLLVERLPATMQLASTAFVLATLIGIPLGVISAVKRDTWIDKSAMVMALLAQAMPTFWLGIMLILVFAVELRWLPTSGTGSLAHFVLPTFTLATYSIARNARLVRSSLLDVLNRDYVRTARAKGLIDRRVIYKHALRNAMIPVITVLGLDFGTLLSGAVITEIVFAWPGIGRLIVNAVSSRDLPLVQGAVLLVSTGFVVINLLVDMSYALLNPRIRLT
jgi:peptide/nickel transport system permease protein